MNKLRDVTNQIKIQRNKVGTEKKRLKELIRTVILIDFRQDLECQYEKMPTPIISSMIDCITFLLGD